MAKTEFVQYVAAPDDPRLGQPALSLEHGCTGRIIKSWRRSNGTYFIGMKKDTDPTWAVYGDDFQFVNLDGGPIQLANS
jgi:hypothetical protein